MNYAVLNQDAKGLRLGAHAVKGPDLRAAVQGIDKARTDYRLAFANGSVDPILSDTP